MSAGERPPEGHPILERVRVGLTQWNISHYGDDEGVRTPELAEGQASGIAYALRDALRSKRLEAGHRSWGEDVAAGAELLALAELYAERGTYFRGEWDAVDYLRHLGKAVRERREVELRGRASWMVGAAAVGFALGRALF